MFDFPFQEPNLFTSFYCLLFYSILFSNNYRKGLLYQNQSTVNKSNQNWTIFFIGFFIVTHCLKGDFFHMMERVHGYSSYSAYVGEEIYYKIGLFVGNNYLLFRTIVWGGAFYLFCQTAKRMQVPVYYAALLLIATHSIIFSYARVSLSMAVYFYGLSFLCRPNKVKLFSYIIGISLILLSREFHSSAVIMIAMTFMLFITIKKWTLIVILVAIPLLVGVLKDYFYLIAFSDSTDEVVAKKMQGYSDREVEKGIAGRIISILQYASFYIPFILSSISLFFNEEYKKCSIEILRFYKVALGFVLASIAFTFMGSTFVTFVYRVLFMSMIPSTIIVVYLYRNEMMQKKHMALCVISGFLFLLIKYMYDIYIVAGQ